MKFYAVRKGRVPGIYTSWDECKEQTNKYPGAVYKSFDTEDAANAFLNVVEAQKANSQDFYCPLTAYTDGSYEDPLGGWGYVLLDGGKPCLKAYGPCTKRNEIRNIGGELEAAEEAIKKALELGADYLCVHHDYEGVGRWGDGEWKTNRPETEAFVSFVNEMRQSLVIEFAKVKGHSDDAYNDMADELAARGVRASDKVEEWIEDTAAAASCEEIAADCPVETKSMEQDADSEYLSFSALLEEMRKKKGLSKAAVAQASGCTRYGKMEAGEDIRLSAAELRSIYDVLGRNSETVMPFEKFAVVWANKQ